MCKSFPILKKFKYGISEEGNNSFTMTELSYPH